MVVPEGLKRYKGGTVRGGKRVGGLAPGVSKFGHDNWEIGDKVGWKGTEKTVDYTEAENI